jgi:hypothetical protein
MGEAGEENEAYTRDFEDVLEAEHALIKKRWGKKKEIKEFVGLALSGGGIRSASFGLGVLQALEKHGWLDSVHYLSTVSGGGYIGSSFTWFKRRREKGDENAAPEEATSFPLGAKGFGARSREQKPGKEGSAPEAEHVEPGTKTFSNAVLSFLRQHGNYLTADRRGVFALVALMVRSTFLSLLVYTLLLTSAFLAIDWVEGNLIPQWARGPLMFDIECREVNGLVLASSSVLLAASLLGALIYSGCTFCLAWGEAKLSGESEFRGKSYDFRWKHRQRGGRVWVAIVVLAVVGSVPFASAYLHEWLHGYYGAEAWIAGVATLAGSLTGVRTFLKQLGGDTDDKSTGGVRGLVGSLKLPFAAFLLLYGLLLLGHSAAMQMTDLGWWKLAPLGLAVAVGGMTSLNYIGVTRMYRDRLMELFMPDDAVVTRNEWWEPALQAEGFSLWQAADPEVRAPYQILNATLNTASDENSKFRGRSGDSFILSPLYCGSNATGWRRTGPLDDNDRKRIASREGENTDEVKPKDLWVKGGLTLASAMAISGAAVNPHSGVRKRDLMRRRAVSMVMAVLNLRLGYWAHNPEKAPFIRKYPASLLWPGMKQLVGVGLDSKSGYVELTDGGHFENLGLYELVRRRVDLIVVSDASADPELSFASLANAVERVRVDFGVSIYFDRTPLSGLYPKTAKKGTETEKYELAARGYAVGTVKYPEAPGEKEKEGTIIYIKPVLTAGLTADLLGYKDANEDFPHETTADQFFDEEQFEAYRELGYRLTDRMWD